jgi:chaperonin GroEL
MSKVFCREQQLNTKLLQGIQLLADNVASTMGPRGRTVIIHERDRRPFATKDGVSVARSVTITDDPVANVAVQIMKQAAEETANTAGDGTTTSTVLARSILVESQKYLAAGISPIELKRGIDKVVVGLTNKVKELAKPVTKLEDVENVATISANGDLAIGKLIAEAVDLTGKDGAVTIKEGKSLQTTLEVVEGFRFKGGIAAGQFITNERLGVMKHERPLFLITDERVDDISQLMPTLELAARAKRPLVIVADDIFGEALAALIVNAMRGSMKVAAIKAPSYGKDRFNTLQDMALAVGSTFISAQTGKTLAEVKLTDLGSAKTVESNKIWTTIVGGEGDSEAISSRIESLREEFKITEDMAECEKLQERITRLSSGVATIHVGGTTEVEMIETKHRIEDALEAVRSAQEEGIVDGGGVVLIKAFSKLKAKELGFDNEHQQLAFKIMQQVVEAPLRQMLKNADEPADVIITNIKKRNIGYNIATRKYCDLLVAGVIDPAKVTRVALQNATSVATTLITTNFAIIDA